MSEIIILPLLFCVIFASRFRRPSPASRPAHRPQTPTPTTTPTPLQPSPIAPSLVWPPRRAFGNGLARARGESACRRHRSPPPSCPCRHIPSLTRHAAMASAARRRSRCVQLTAFPFASPVCCLARVAMQRPTVRRPRPSVRPSVPHSPSLSLSLSFPRVSAALRGAAQRRARAGRLFTQQKERFPAKNGGSDPGRRRIKNTRGGEPP